MYGHPDLVDDQARIMRPPGPPPLAKSKRQLILLRVVIVTFAIGLIALNAVLTMISR